MISAASARRRSGAPNHSSFPTSQGDANVRTASAPARLTAASRGARLAALRYVTSGGTSNSPRSELTARSSLRCRGGVEEHFPAAVRLLAPHPDVFRFRRLRLPGFVVQGQLVIANLECPITGHVDRVRRKR